jgi:short-subunit dehydrogenase
VPERARTALITGASSGIGEAFADVFSAEGFDLVLTARREDRLRAVAERLTRQHGRRAVVIVADLAEPGACARICEELDARGIVVDALVNNAGYGVPGTFVKSDWECHQAQLQVMVMAVADLTRRLIPGMIERGYGRVVNVASLAGLMPAPGGHTLYAAAKAFVIKFSESLADEVRPHGVHVTAVCPGFTYSEFHDVTGTRARVNMLPKCLWLDAATVAEKGFEAVMAGRSIEITGRVNRTIEALGRYLPRPVLNYLARRTAKGHRQL